jgi:hypothetical protein
MLSARLDWLLGRTHVTAVRATIGAAWKLPRICPTDDRYCPKLRHLRLWLKMPLCSAASRALKTPSPRWGGWSPAWRRPGGVMSLEKHFKRYSCVFSPPLAPPRWGGGCSVPRADHAPAASRCDRRGLTPHPSSRTPSVMAEPCFQHGRVCGPEEGHRALSHCHPRLYAEDPALHLRPASIVVAALAARTLDLYLLMCGSSGHAGGMLSACARG